MMRSETLCRRVSPLRKLKNAIANAPVLRRVSTFAAGRRNRKVQVHEIDPGTITIDSFSMCCAASSQLEFESFVKLFDRDRGLTFLEKFFLPPSLSPSTLFLGGRECTASAVASNNSLFNLHDRHQAEIAVLEEWRTNPRGRPNPLTVVPSTIETRSAPSAKSASSDLQGMSSR